MDYIPTTDDGKLAFGQNMVEKITPDPVSYGLTTSIATNLDTRVTTYQSALSLARQDGTKGRSVTYAKNVARKSMVDYIRQIVLTINGTPSVTDQMKYDLGLNVRGDNPPTPINPPQDAPLFEVLWVKNRLIGVKLRPTDSARRGRPIGVQGASICMYAGPLPLPTEITAWVTIGESTRTKFEAEVPPNIPAGTTVHLVAFWKSPRLMSGPPSSPVSLVIGGGVQQTG